MTVTIRATAPGENYAEIDFDAQDAQGLGERFVELLIKEVGIENFFVACERNEAQKDPRICHSHDFCDANMVMLAAWDEMVKIECDPASNTQSALWNGAWEHAVVLMQKRLDARFSKTSRPATE